MSGNVVQFFGGGVLHSKNYMEIFSLTFEGEGGVLVNISFFRNIPRFLSKTVLRFKHITS